MTDSFQKMTRRSFLSAAALVPAGALGSLSHGRAHHFQYDHVIGTSMDLVVWSRDAAISQRAEDSIVAEISRLCSVLNTRDPNSEISRLAESSEARHSSDLHEVFAAYEYWEQQTGGRLSMRPAGPHSARNVDALGKAYIIDRAVAAARRAAPGMDGLLLNIGGDIVAWGDTQEIAIADPGAPQDNAPPITRIAFRNAAVATSGSYARGTHLLDGRTGEPSQWGVSATVVARDAVVANALATTLCVTGAEEGLRLVSSTPGAEALRIGPDGKQMRSSGFARLERPLLIRTAMAADWPAGFQMTIALTVKEGQSAFGGGRGGFGGGRGGFGGGRGTPRPYVAVWVENTSGKLVRVLAFWANKPQYYRELSSFFTAVGRNQNLMYSMARATRPPGSYELVWDGLDDQRKPLTAGTYRIVVETNQEHGSYGKQGGTIECAEAPATLTLPATANFETVMIQYGPKSNRA